MNGNGIFAPPRRGEGPTLWEGAIGVHSLSTFLGILYDSRKEVCHGHACSTYHLRHKGC